MSFRTEYRLSLTFKGPLISQAAGTLALGVDTAMQRYRGGPVLNGSLVRGNIRYALEKFQSLLRDDELATDITHWFGEASMDNSFRPKRAGVEFDCFWQLTGQCQGTAARRTRIAIDEDSGRVERGALQVIEDCFPSGGPSPVFEGMIRANFQNDKQKRHFLHWIGKALDYIPAMGSFKGVGFGRLESWRLEDITPTKPVTKSTPFVLPDRATRFGVVLSLDRPFCLGRPRTPDSNRIVSDDVIRGNVIKGVIAKHYNDDADKLQQQLCFDELIVSHALPAKAGSKTHGKPLPLSLAIHRGQVVDMAGLFKGPESLKWGEAPIFQPDWKQEGYERAYKAFGIELVEPGRLLLVRTQIDREYGVSAEGRLFTLECIDPNDYVWCADIELCKVPERRRQEVCERLVHLLQQGLSGIGKTKAHASIEIQPSPFYQTHEELVAWQDCYYIVTLRTPARLLPQDLAISSINSHVTLKSEYQKYWTDQHSGIKLRSYYAQQTLTGTWYHQQQHNRAADYNPEWLTNAGSVFVLQVEDQSAVNLLAQWCKTGLPASCDVDSSVPSWQTTPFLPEHGFGQILVNDPSQVALLFKSEGGT